MMEFHIGDYVRTIGVYEGLIESFVITEFKQFNHALCATGEGHAWWDVDDLDYAIQEPLNEEQQAIVEKLERALHSAAEALLAAVIMQKEASRKGIPGWMIKRIRRIAGIMPEDY
jgi:hypothetical protein